MAIGSILMLFVALTSAYIVRSAIVQRLASDRNAEGALAEHGANSMSSVTIEAARRSLKTKYQQRMDVGW